MAPRDAKIAAVRDMWVDIHMLLWAVRVGDDMAAYWSARAAVRGARRAGLVSGWPTP